MTSYDIAVIGGTGPQGRGLAYRWAKHGHRVVLGSRSADRATEAAAEIAARVPAGSVSGASNADAAAGADVVVLAVPYDGHDDLVRGLAGVAGVHQLGRELHGVLRGALGGGYYRDSNAVRISRETT